MINTPEKAHMGHTFMFTILYKNMNADLNIVSNLELFGFSV